MEVAYIETRWFLWDNSAEKLDNRCFGTKQAAKNHLSKYGISLTRYSIVKVDLTYKIGGLNGKNSR